MTGSQQAFELASVGPAANIKVTRRPSVLTEPRRDNDVNRTAKHASAIGELNGYSVHRASCIADQGLLRTGDIILVSARNDCDISFCIKLCGSSPFSHCGMILFDPDIAPGPLLVHCSGHAGNIPSLLPPHQTTGVIVVPLQDFIDE